MVRPRPKWLKPCPKHRPKPVSYLLADVIDEYLKHNKSKRSWRDDDRHGNRWKERMPGRTGGPHTG